MSNKLGLMKLSLLLKYLNQRRLGNYLSSPNPFTGPFNLLWGSLLRVWVWFGRISLSALKGELIVFTVLVSVPLFPIIDCWWLACLLILTRLKAQSFFGSLFVIFFTLVYVGLFFFSSTSLLTSLNHFCFWASSSFYSALLTSSFEAFLVLILACRFFILRMVHSLNFLVP